MGLMAVMVLGGEGGSCNGIAFMKFLGVLCLSLLWRWFINRIVVVK